MPNKAALQVGTALDFASLAGHVDVVKALRAAGAAAAAANEVRLAGRGDTSLRTLAGIGRLKA